MNLIRKTVLLLMLVSVLPFRAQSQRAYSPHYSPVTLGTNPMSVTMVVFIDGMEQERTDLELGAFTDDICRGNSFFKQFPMPPKQYLAMPTIHGNNGDVVTFRLYDHTVGEELNLICLSTIAFQEGQNLGNAQSPINVYFVTSGKTYMFVNDADMLVAGRHFLIGNACDGMGKLMSGHNVENQCRISVGAEFSNLKTEQDVANNPSAVGLPFQFTLNGNTDVWNFFDEAAGKSLSVNESGGMELSDSPADWKIEVDPSGGVEISTIVGETKYYLFYDEETDSFYCCETENTLYLFVKCQPISGSMAQLNVTDAAQMYLVESGTTLEVGSLSTENPFNLVVEDGAQLISASSAQVVVRKNIFAYANANQRDGWYTLASPVAGEIASSSNLISNDFDLFFFRETVVTKEWRNYKDPENNFTDFECGRGYLYANSNDLMLNFKGTMNTIAATYAMTYTDSRPDDLKGFALVGNPFAHNIKKGSGGAIEDARLASGYYTLTHSGEWETHTDDELISPCQGVLIQTSEAGDLTINKMVATSSRVAQTDGHIAIEVVGEQGHDKAFVYFGEGIGLNKMVHFSEAPMLYLRQNSKDYAVAHYDANATVGEIPVFFEASENGKYVISVANDGVCFDYLHLVDNLTGVDVDLLDNAVPYTFAAKINDYAARFKLVYQMHRNVENQSDDFCYFADGRLVIPFIDGETTLQIVDMTGRIVINQSVGGSFSQTLNLKTGVYVVRMGDRMQKIVAE